MPTLVTGQIRVGIIGAGLIGQLHSMMLRYVADRTEQSVRVVSIADISHPAAEKLASRWQGARALESAEEIIADFPDLTREDIRACLAYAAEQVRPQPPLPAA